MADETTIEDVFEFFAERSADEEATFRERNGDDIPNHAEILVVDAATDLAKDVTSANMARAIAGEDDDVAEDEMRDTILESTVDLIAAIGTLKHELGLDIAEAVDDRMGFIEDMDAFEAAMKEADTEGEKMDAMDEYLTDELEAELGLQAEPSLEAGDNVDAEGYEHDGTNRSFQ